MARNPAARNTIARSTFRNDINGLRAVAVLAVVVNHLTGYPLGGFVGVDIFFVISGYLITGQLVRAVETTGRVGYSDFYRKRIRRIMPAALVTLVVTVAAAFVIMRTAAAKGVAVDAIWSALSLGNWHFAAVGTDYWAESANASPLQHFWSLAVEEQYYLVWPVLITVVALLVGRSAPHVIRRALLVAVGLVVVVSFGWAMVESAQHETFAYFNTASRAWELGAGSALAIAPRFARGLGRAGHVVLTWAGLVGLGVAIALDYSGVAFPGPGAAVAVLATCAVIAGGAHGGKAPWLLRNPVSRYLGEISYSLYLWHFPVIVFLAVFMDAASWPYTVVVLAASFALAVLSFHFVETPVRRSSWLVDGWFRRPDFSRPSVKIGIVSLAAVFVVSMTAAAEFRQRAETASVTARIASEQTAAPSAEGTEGDTTSAVQSLRTQIAAATKLQSWPEKLTPSLDDVLTEGLPKVQNAAGCEKTDVSDPTSCRFGNTDSDKMLVAVGNSTGLTGLPGLIKAYGDEYTIRGLTMSGCSMLDLDAKTDDAAFRAECLEQRAAVRQAVNDLKPDIVVLTHTYSGIDALVSGATGAAATAEWQTAAEKFLSDTTASGSKVVFLPAPPAGTEIATCATNFNGPSDCTTKIPASYKWGEAAEQNAARGSDGRAVFVSTRALYCTGSGECPPIVADIIVKRDSGHVTPQYSEFTAPAIRELVDAALAG